MKKCDCGSTEFVTYQQVYVKFLVDGNLNFIGHEMRKPKYTEGLITCNGCGKQYTESSFQDLNDKE